MNSIKRVAVYLSSTMPSDTSYSEAVVEVGKYLVSHNMELVFGGSNEGIMKTLANAVLDNGGRAIGVFTKELPASMIHPGLSERYIAENMAERKAKMLELSDGQIVLPGSFGTWDELFDALALYKVNLLFHGKSKPVGLLNVNGFYDHLIAFIRHAEEVGITPPKCRGMLKIASGIDELMALMQQE